MSWMVTRRVNLMLALAVLPMNLFFVGVNALHPESFSGEDMTGVMKKTFAQLREIADRCVMCHPAPPTGRVSVRSSIHGA